MTKWIFYLLVFVYMCYRAVYGGKPDKNHQSIAVEQINYGESGFLEVGTRKTINCKGSARNQKLEWVDPLGNLIKRTPSSRVFIQEQFSPSPKGSRNTALALTIKELLVSDSGLFLCKSGDQMKTVPVCVIKPSEFVDTPAEVVIEAGHSITLICQAKGDPEPRIVWYRDGRELAEGDDIPKYKVARKFNRDPGYESHLTIISVEPEDEGLYNCMSVQESPMLDNCTHSDSFNITLQVSRAPQITNKNKVVFGKSNEVVDLKCAASGWPTPSFRWFKELSDDALYEFDKSKINFIEGMAVLSVTAGPTTFEKMYKCVASNTFGDSEMRFQLLKTEEPTEANVEKQNVSATNALFKVTWDAPIDFPIRNFDIQYINVSNIGSRLREKDWENANEVHHSFDKDESEDTIDDIVIELYDLQPETRYIVRLRATNDVGEAPWSQPVRITTLEKNVIVETSTENGNTEAAPGVAASVGGDNGTFYGIFFAGGILIIAAVCMFAMRMV